MVPPAPITKSSLCAEQTITDSFFLRGFLEGMDTRINILEFKKVWIGLWREFIKYNIRKTIMIGIVKITSSDIDLLHDVHLAYLTSSIFLDFGGYFLNRNGENIVVLQDSLYPHEFPAIVLPKNKKNWENFSILFATEKEIAELKSEGIPLMVVKEIGQEYYYKTEDFVNPRGALRKKIEQFKQSYSYNVFSHYDKKRILDFYTHWKSQKAREAFTFPEAEEFFLFCLENLDKYGVKQVYIEIDGTLVGLAWGVAHQAGGWVGLHLKVDYSVKGLSRFLHHERAKMFSDEFFTLGTGAHEKGIDTYKEELGPAFTKKYSYVLTGSRES